MIVREHATASTKSAVHEQSSSYSEAVNVLPESLRELPKPSPHECDRREY